MKKALLICLCLFCCAISHARILINDLYYELDEETMEAEVVYRTYDSPGGGYFIPETIVYQDKTYTVTRIGKSAFSNSFMMSVYIPKTIKSIGKGAFSMCSYLVWIRIYDLKAWCGIKFEDSSANPNHYNSSLYLVNGSTAEEIVDLVIPESVTEISDYAFYNCGCLQSVSMPESLLTIGNSAFENCSGLTSVSISKSVTTIGDRAFAYCSNLTSIDIPESVTSIGNAAFYNSKFEEFNVDAANTAYCSVDGVLFNKDKTAIETFPAGKKGAYVIPETVKNIGDYAFYCCEGLTSVTIPESVTSIGNWAFPSCHLLQAITIPRLVTDIGEYAFSYCAGITSISIPESVTSIRRGTFSGCTNLRNVSIPESVTSIESSAFANCAMSTISIPELVTSIEGGAFYGCKNLYSINIPKLVASIDYSMFEGCDNLSEINVDTENAVYCSINGVVFSKDSTILKVFPYGKGGTYSVPKYVSKIGESSFFNNRNLASISIPASVKEIGQSAFANSNLKELYLYSLEKPEVYYSGTFNFATTCVLYVPLGAVDVYESIVSSDSKWGGFSGVEGFPVLITDVEAVKQNPTSLLLIGSCSDEYMKATETGFESYGNGNSLLITGLEPSMAQEVIYYAISEDGYKESKAFSFTTPALELTTLAPKVVSSTCAVVAATTNIGEEETGVGFQWKKYDAPASLAPSEGYAAIYDGQLEGYIKNLQSTSYYNVRAFYKSAADKYYYGEWVTFDPSDFSYFEPTVHTYPVQETSTSHAKLKGYVMAGTDEITEQGFEYWPLGTSESKARRVFATVAADDVSVVLATGQVMTAVIDELTPGTTYCYRAFVRTAGGTTYGEEQTSATEAGTTGISNTMTDGAEPTVIGYYDMNGRKQNDLQKGLNIIRYSDGSARKVVVK